MAFLPVDALAILAATTMSTLSILNRQGLKTGTPYMAAVVINSTVVILYLALCTALGVAWLDLPPTGVFWFLVTGICSPALSTTLYYISLARFGVGRAAPIAMGSSPLFAVLIAIAVLGERPGWSLYLGTVLIIGGIWVVSRPKGEQRLKWKEVVIPLGAGFFWGLSGSIRKIGLQIIPAPHIGIVIQTISTLAFLLAAYRLFPRGKRMVRSGRAVKFFSLAGVSLAVSFYFLFSALAAGQVSRVMAIMGSAPLLTVALAAVFLRDVERITLRTYLGAASIVAGIVLITLFRG